MKNEQSGFTLLELLVALVVTGLLVTIALPAYNGAVEKARIVQATNDIVRIEGAIERSFTNSGLPANLAAIGMDTLIDPWGNPYRYLNIEALPNPGVGVVRKDHNLIPINRDYDLYSMGKDGRTVSPLTGTASRDDIVRAGNGGFVGLVEDYGPDRGPKIL